jgi:polysaccharide export outer membrane protein
VTKHRFIAISAAILMLAGTGGASGARLPEMSMTAPGVYQLGPGDQIRITVFGLDAITNTYLIDDTGEVALPMLDPVKVAGKTLRQAEASIASQIRAKQLVNDPKVSAQIIAYRPFYIAGEVQKPGQYPYVPGMSLMTAVSIAGGYTFRANTRSATITRASQKGSATADTPVLPGDMIVVRESWF